VLAGNPFDWRLILGVPIGLACFQLRKLVAQVTRVCFKGVQQELRFLNPRASACPCTLRSVWIVRFSGYRQYGMWLLIVLVRVMLLQNLVEMDQEGDAVLVFAAATSPAEVWILKKP